MNYKITFYCLLIFACFSLHAQNEKIRVAVFDPTSSGTGIDEGTKLAVREIISSVFVNTGKYTIVERSLIDKVMQEQKFSNSGAVDDSQISEIGKVLGANKIVLSVVTLAGGRNMLSLKLVDVQTADVERQRTQIITTDELLSTIEPLTLQLIGEEVGSKRQIQIATVQTPQQTERTNPDSKPETSPSIQRQPSVQNVNKVSPAIPNPIQDMELIYVEGSRALRGAKSPRALNGFYSPKGMNSFYIGKHEITQAQWDAVMGANPSQFRGSTLPVESISWNEVQVFINRLNDITGLNYRLPTESEWLYAAKGGKYMGNYQYAGSNNIDDVAWYNKKHVRKAGTYPVGNKRPNALGIYDMTGNVWEWCQDAVKGGHIIRGGSWNDDSKSCRLKNSRRASGGRDASIGFRIVLSE